MGFSSASNAVSQAGDVISCSDFAEQRFERLLVDGVVTGVFSEDLIKIEGLL